MNFTLVKILMIAGLLSSSFAYSQSFKSKKCGSYRVLTSQQGDVTLRMQGKVTIAAINLDGVVLLFDEMKTEYAGQSRDVTCLRVNYTDSRMVGFLAPQVSSLLGKKLTFNFRASRRTTSSGPVNSLLQIAE